jgi:hypothetical protein
MARPKFSRPTHDLSLDGEWIQKLAACRLWIGGFLVQRLALSVDHLISDRRILSP